MRLALLLLLAVTTLAQSLTTAAQKLNLRPGETTTITYTLAGQGTPTIAAFQWTETATGLTTSLPVAMGSAVNKLVACGNATAKICLVYNVGTQAINNGQVVTVSVSVPLSAPPGTLTYKVSSTLGSTALGVAVPLASPADLTFTILSKVDLNGDGKVDVVDVNIVMQQVIGNQPVTSCDVNGDSVCNVADLMMVGGQVVP